VIDPSIPQWVLPGLSTAALAIVSGAGGSALLELFWKPRRDRKRVAGTLLGEILVNTELALLWAHSRQKNPRSIPADLRFSTLGWNAVGGLITELHADLVKSTLLLYTRYQHLNFCIQEYGRVLDELAKSDVGSNRESTLKRELNATIDVFNTSVDIVFDQGRELAGKLLPVARIKESAKDAQPARDYAADVDKLLRDRARRMKDLEG
jgi:hypothetical protein